MFLLYFHFPLLRSTAAAACRLCFSFLSTFFFMRESHTEKAQKREIVGRKNSAERHRGIFFQLKIFHFVTRDGIKLIAKTRA